MRFEQEERESVLIEIWHLCDGRKWRRAIRRAFLISFGEMADRAPVFGEGFAVISIQPRRLKSPQE
jgi:hypothetical protein